jgi:hypothetical protein
MFVVDPVSIEMQVALITIEAPLTSDAQGCAARNGKQEFRVIQSAKVRRPALEARGAIRSLPVSRFALG